MVQRSESGKNFRASTALAENFEELSIQLKMAGWKYRPVVINQGNDKPSSRFGAFVRDIPNPLAVTKGFVNQSESKDNIFSNDTVTKKNERLTQIEKSSNSAGLNHVVEAGGECSYWKPMVPLAPVVTSCSAITEWSDVPSISRMRFDDESITLAIDSEFISFDDEREILTWQFSFVTDDPNLIHEVVFFSLLGDRLPLVLALSWIITEFRLFNLPFVVCDKYGYYYRDTRRWIVPVVDKKGKYHKVCCVSYEKAMEICNIPEYREKLASVNASHKKNLCDDNDVGYVNDFRDYSDLAIPVTLLFHSAIADLTGFGFYDFDRDILRDVSSVSGGLVSIRSFYLHPHHISKWYRFYPIKADMRDTMCFAPSHKKTLESLGAAIGVPKLEIMDGYSIADMLRYLLEQPVPYFEYAINDAVVTLLYASTLWSYNTAMPLTISSAVLKASVPVLQEYFGVDDMQNYNKLFRGLVSERKSSIKRADKPGYLSGSSLVPVSDDAKFLQSYAKDSYKGGYNASVDIGWYDGLTYDYDLRNAYATSMSLCFDIDWLGDKVIAREWHNERMLLQDFRTPYDPIFGYFTFEFPPDVKFPCIPVTIDGSLIYPRTSGNAKGYYAAGPEIYLALRLGATVTAKRAVQGAYLFREDGAVSHSLRSVIKDFIRDRDLAKKAFGEGSLAETLLKDAGNSLYGKLSQDIISKQSWDAYRQRMVDIGGSAMTSPAHASIITSGVRAVLLATANELSGMGYRVFSITTDGFITDAPMAVVENLDLFGFRRLFEAARLDLVGDPSVWQMKHAQEAFLNITTRGNVALNTVDTPVVVNGKGYAGVCAHNSFVTGYPSDSFDDRRALTTTVLSRTGRCSCSNKSFAKFRDVSSPVDRKDFLVTTQTRKISMDFDLKRKPLGGSMETVFPVVAGKRYEVANFTSVPYEDAEEFIKYKRIGRGCISNGCLRTVRDWDRFFAKLDGVNTSVPGCSPRQHIVDVEWSRIMTLVMGYRLGFWDIPYLSEKRPISEKLDYINSLNKSQKVFTLNNWKDCRKAARKSQMLNKNFIVELLKKCHAIIFEQPAG